MQEEIRMYEKLTTSEQAEVYVTGGFAHPELTNQIAEEMGVEMGGVEYKIHPNGEIYTRFTQNLRKKSLFIVQSHVGTETTSINDAIMQQHLLVDAARSSSAEEITVVSPYMAYMRQDRKSHGREPIGTRVLINQIQQAGAHRIVTVDMHAAQAQAVFDGPFDHLTAQPLLRRAIREEIAQFNQDEWLVVAPDAGAGKMAERHRTKLGTGLLQLAKMRDPNDNQKIRRETSIPEADGRVCILFDDMIDTAGTLTTAAEALKNSGAKAIYVAATHGILSDPAIDRLKDAPIDRVLVTDTLPVSVPQYELGEKLRVVPVAPMIGEALMRIIRGDSLSEMFDDQNHM
jgi:ribose-phosphate pyrophosphokinase